MDQPKRQEKSASSPPKFSDSDESSEQESWEDQVKAAAKPAGTSKVRHKAHSFANLSQRR